MTFQIGLPGILDGRLEGDHQHPMGSELPRQLVGGEGLAEAHLRVPQKARRGSRVFRPDRAVIRQGLVHRLGLLPAHREVFVMRAGVPLAGAQFQQRGFDVLDRAAHPFQHHILEAFPLQRGADLVVAEQAAVVALRRLVQFNPVIPDGGGLELFGHSLLHVAGGLADLEQTRVLGIGDRVGVDAKPCGRPGG